MLDKNSLIEQCIGALRKRLYLTVVRLLYRNAVFGSAVDVRKHFSFRQGCNGVVRFGERCILDVGMTVECHGILNVGKRVIFGHHCTIAARERIEIGDDCMFAEMVSIRDHDHAFTNVEVPYREQGFTCAPVRIGRNVWVAAKVTVCKGVFIGDNCIIGANAVLTKNIPSNSLAVGIPARVIRQLRI